MLVNLIGDEESIFERNRRIQSIIAENPDDEIWKDWKPIKRIEEVFCPYSKWLATATPEEKDKYLKLQDFSLNTDGVYITELNYEYDFELTTSRIVEDRNLSPEFRFKSYGVCDNASQAIEYYNKLIDENIIKNEDNFVIMLTPMFKCAQPEWGGWRWHKWGQYIGIQNPCHEYLYDEKDIELVFVFSIEKLK